MKNRDVDVLGEGIAGAALKSPSPEMSVVATPSGWTTEGPVQRGTNRLMASLDSGATSMSTGSDSAAAPGGMVIPPEPPKVIAWSVAASIAPIGALDAGFAIWAAPMTSGWWPVSLEKRTRTCLPPALRRTIWRNVW